MKWKAAIRKASMLHKSWKILSSSTLRIEFKKSWERRRVMFRRKMGILPIKRKRAVIAPALGGHLIPLVCSSELWSTAWCTAKAVRKRKINSLLGSHRIEAAHNCLMTIRMNSKELRIEKSISKVKAFKRNKITLRACHLMQRVWIGVILP